MGSLAGSLQASRAAWVNLGPGLALVIGLGLVALAVESGVRVASGGQVAVVEALVIALILGVIVRNTWGLPALAKAGVGYAGKQLLEFAVLLLGAGMNVASLVAAGPVVLGIVLLGVALTLGLSTGVGRVLGLSAKLAVLVAVGNAICGNSAIAAAAPVIKADRKDVASAVALTAVVGVLLVLGLPFLAPVFHMTMYQYGVLVGTTVYAVPQVVAASFPVSPESGEVATAVKLVRVLLIGPVVLALSFLFRAEGGGEKKGWSAFKVPWFITGFLVLAAITSLGILPGLSNGLGLGPNGLGGGVREVSKALMIIAMAALGLGVEFAAVRSVGPRVLATVLISTGVLVVVSLFLVLGLGPGS